ncbi:MAG: hypothetical protein ACI4JC_07625 [Faecalibacterium sp.]
MNILLLFVFCFGGLLCLGRGLDLALWTDLSTGLCVAGSVWWRYAVLGAAMLLCIVLPRLGAPRCKDPLCRCRPLAGALAFAAAGCFAIAGLLQLPLGFVSISSLLGEILELVCAVWLLCLGRSWLRGGAWKTPAGGLVLGIAGTAIFYVGILYRFLVNSSSWHRVLPTAEVWRLMSALLFLSALLRALWLPGTQPDAAVCAGGLAAFWLCLCWGLPQTVMLAMAGQTTWPDLAFQVGLCCVGAMGGICAASYLKKPRGAGREKIARNSCWPKCPKP